MSKDFRTPRSRKAAKAVHVLRAMFNAKPKKARKAGRRAEREFDRRNPKPRPREREGRSFA